MNTVTPSARASAASARCSSAGTLQPGRSRPGNWPPRGPRPVGRQRQLLSGGPARASTPVGELPGQQAVRVVLGAEQLPLPQRVVGVLDRQRRPLRRPPRAPGRVGRAPGPGPAAPPTSRRWRCGASPAPARAPPARRAAASARTGTSAARSNAYPAADATAAIHLVRRDRHDLQRPVELAPGSGSAGTAPRRPPGTRCAAPRAGRSRPAAPRSARPDPALRTAARPPARCTSRSAPPAGRGTTAAAARTTTAPARVAAARASASRAPAASVQPRRQPGHRRRLEQRPQRHLHAQHRPHPADQPHRQQRVPAEVEEVVVDADPVQAEHLGERPAQDLLRGPRRTPARRGPPPRSPAPAAPAGPACRWPSAAARPARRPPRAPCTPAAPPRRTPARSSRPPAPSPAPLRVGRGPRRRPAAVPRRVLPDQHRGLGHPRVRGQHGLDLAELDPEPADLHLVVGPAQELQPPVRRSTAPGPRSGTSAPRPAERTRPRTAPRSAPAGPGSPGPAARRPGTAHPPRPAAPAAAAASSTYTRVFAHRRPIGTGPPSGGRHGQAVTSTVASVGPYRLCSSRAGQRRGTGPPASGGSASPAADHPPQARAPRRAPARRRNASQHRRHEVRPSSPPLAGSAAARYAGSRCPSGRASTSARARQQRPEELPDRHVEAGRRLLQHPVAERQPVLGLHPHQPVDDRPRAATTTPLGRPVDPEV